MRVFIRWEETNTYGTEDTLTPLVFMTCMFQPSIPTAITKKVMPSMRTILKKINEQNRKKYVKTAIVLSPLLKIRERQFLPALPLDL